MSRSTGVRRNSSISKVWDTLKSAQKWAALRAAGVDKDRAGANAMVDWSDLAPDIKGRLLAGWNMATVGGTTRRYSKGDTTRRVPVLTNPEDGWRVTHDGETLKVFGKKDDDAGAGAAFRWLQQRQSQSVDWAIRYEGYDIVKVEGGKVVFSRRREIDQRGTKRNPVAKPFAVEGSHTYAVGFKGGGWRIYETYKTYDDAMDWAKFIMKEGIPGVRGNVQALVLRPTGQRSYSVYWRGVRRVASNPVPIWMQSDEMFHKVVGVSIKEWQRIFRGLPEWKKKEFHRRAGKKILSANAMKWVVSQGQPSALPNRHQVPIEFKGEAWSTRFVAYLRKRGVRAQMKPVAGRPGWFAFFTPSSHAEKAESLIYKYTSATTEDFPSDKARASEKRWRLRQTRRQHRRGYRKTGYHRGGKHIGVRPNPSRIWYVGLCKTERGLLWDAKESIRSLRKGIVGKILKISAPSSSKAIQEAWKHRRRLGL